MVTKNAFQHQLAFQVPITAARKKEENAKETFLIRGTAINETTTLNGSKFIAEELSKAAPSLRNKPLLKDHKNEVDSIVGRTTDNVYFDETTRAIIFEARVHDPIVQEKIDAGLIDSVSVGAYVEQVEHEKNEDDQVTAEVLYGIRFVELSLTPVPADQGATFAKAIAEAYHEFSSTIATAKQQEDARMAEEKLTLEQIRAEKEQLELELETLKLEALRAEKEKLTAKPAPVEATVGEVVTAAVEPQKVLVNTDGGVSLTANYEAYGAKNMLGHKPSGLKR